MLGLISDMLQATQLYKCSIRYATFLCDTTIWLDITATAIVDSWHRMILLKTMAADPRLKLQSTEQALHEQAYQSWRCCQSWPAAAHS